MNLTAIPQALVRRAPAPDLRPAALWNTLSKAPGGRALFTRGVCLRAPYFGSIDPQIHDLRPGACEVRIKDRRSVHNHLGTVHAIAMCNMAELSAGMATEVTVPDDARWIPVGMTVEYVRKARGDLRAVATLDDIPPHEQGVDVVARVEITDPDEQVVMRAAITMRVTPKPRT